MNQRLLTFLAIVILAPASAALAEECSLGGMPSDCILSAEILVRAVDAKRFLIGVDTRAPGETADGLVDHLFLYTGGEPPGALEPMPFSGTVSIFFGEKRAEIRTETGSWSVSFGHNQMSHYWGYGSSGGRLEALMDLRQASKCDHVPGSCWVGEGWRIAFPS